MTVKVSAAGDIQPELKQVLRIYCQCCCKAFISGSFQLIYFYTDSAARASSSGREEILCCW